MLHSIFVFGTLKEGFPNYGHNDGQRVAGRFHTELPFKIYLVGDRYTPWMIIGDGGSSVIGEVYTVDDAGLARMDLLERVGKPDGYQRETINVLNSENGESCAVFVYLKQADQLDRDLIRAGPLSDYTMADAAKYRPRSDAG